MSLYYQFNEFIFYSHLVQFCDTDLEQYLKSHKFTETQIKSFLKQLSIGVKAMHDQGIYIGSIHFNYTYLVRLH